jgi:hypothetical protein
MRKVLLVWHVGRIQLNAMLSASLVQAMSPRAEIGIFLFCRKPNVAIYVFVTPGQRN